MTHSADLDTVPFQFTPLREGRRSSGAASVTNGKFQFTPLREGRLSETGRYQAGEIISIHAPPRGATKEEEDDE